MLEIRDTQSGQLGYYEAGSRPSHIDKLFLPRAWATDGSVRAGTKLSNRTRILYLLGDFSGGREAPQGLSGRAL
ncbi:hypothetical protein N7510_006695 [Penicillium lagena]|uniref:uncharacterized protein n=1 Tax=Penicillium lagena TaxID=94218 RepID=UPI0025406B8F|nr:uncharacterized protein N7510_006695 [Penicillium lagena]KAJ5609976.1 hypothetical protein N7510_006695 [Penicillium lagena]